MSTWFQHVDTGTIYMGSLVNPAVENFVPEPIPNSSSAWTFGKPADNFEGTRDHVICFEFAMFGANVPHGISVVFYRARSQDGQTIEYANTGGLTTAFGFLDNSAYGTVVSPSLSGNTGLASAHACVVLDIEGTYGNGNLSTGQSPQPNSVVVSGPFDTATTKRQVTSLADTPFEMFKQTTDVNELQFIDCRVSLTDLGRNIYVEMRPADRGDKYTMITSCNIGEYFDDDYTMPPELKSSLLFHTSADGGICAIRDATVTGYGARAVDTYTVPTPTRQLDLLPVFADDACTGNTHITHNQVNNWTTDTGTLDPFMLHDGTLKRSSSATADVSQLMDLQQHTTYEIVTDGDCTVAFSNTSNDPVDYTWGNGSEARFQSFESEKPQRVTFGQTPPDKITIQLSTGGHHVSHVSMVDVQHPTVNLVTNPAFDQIESTTYTVDLWLEVSNDTRVIPADATGWIEGFNYNEIYGT